MRRVSSCVAVFVGVIVSLAATAHAQTARAPSDPRAAAAESFREAQAAFARRDFAAAAAAFEQTARTVPHAATWLNAAEAWEKRGEWARAAEDCDRALEVPGADAEIRREAARRLAIAITNAATLEIRGPRGMGARVDGNPIQTLPIKRRLAPGAHRVVVVELATERETRSHNLVLAAGASEIIEVSASPPAPATPPDRATPASPSSSKGDRASRAPPASSLIAFGIGGALAATTGVLGVMTLEAKSAYERDPSRETLDAFRRDRLVTNISVGGAVVAVAVGAVLWALSANERSPATAVHPTRLTF